MDQNETVLNDLWQFDIHQSCWTLVHTENTPEPRESHTAVVVGDQMIIFGGVTFPNDAKDQLVNLDQLHFLSTLDYPSRF